MRRILTETEEQIIRAVHHDFDGLSLTEASKRLRIPTIDIVHHLKEIQVKAPQLFPILPFKLRILTHMYEAGSSVDCMSTALQLNERRVRYLLECLRRDNYIGSPPKCISYNPSMDDEVRERF